MFTNSILLGREIILTYIAQDNSMELATHELRAIHIELDSLNMMIKRLKGAKECQKWILGNPLVAEKAAQ